MSKRLILIDGDILQYRCGFAADGQLRRDLKEKNPEWSDEQVKEEMESLDYLAFALRNVRSAIEDMFKELGNHPYKLFLTGEGNFRDQIATIKPYKGNRDSSHRPKYYREIKEYMIDRWGAEVIRGKEADDALGVEQWARPDKSSVIVTVDKDLDMIPGWHYNWVKREKYCVSLQEANYHFFFQMLKGDSTDNIPGINRLGDARIPPLLDPIAHDTEAMKALVAEKYQNQYGDNWKDAYNEVAALLWMERVEGQPCDFLIT